MLVKINFYKHGRSNELELENQLFISMGRIQDMAQNFQVVEQQQGKI